MTRRIPLHTNALLLTDILVILWNHQIQPLQLGWGFDKRSSKSSFDMPLDVAVEERNAWIVDFETYDGVAIAVDEHGVATHRRFRDGGIRRWKKWWTVVGAGAGA